MQLVMKIREHQRKGSAGLANKQNKHVLVAPTFQGGPLAAEAIVYIFCMEDIMSKLLDFFRIP